MRHLCCLTAALAVTGCAPARDGCESAGEPITLRDEVREASGVAASRAHRDVLWIHNDSDGGAVVFAVTTAGESLGQATLNGAHNRDWEDIAVARCPTGGPDSDCIYVADIGDNRAARETIGLWIAAEPEPRANTESEAVFVRMRYPDGARDAEAIGILDDGSAIIVSKGREHPISVYRSGPLEWQTGQPREMTLTLVQRLSDAPASLPDQVTGAAVDRGGRIAVRSYATLQFYRVDDAGLTPLLAEPFRLDSLGEPQGEGVAFGRRGRVYLVSEAGPQGIAPRLTLLRCRIP